MNIEEINELLDDVDTRYKEKFGREKASEGNKKCVSHRDRQMEKEIEEIFARRELVRVSLEYLQAEYESWKSELEKLPTDEQVLIHDAIIASGVFQVGERVNGLTPMQKVFYHAGTRLFELQRKYGLYPKRKE